MKKYVCTMIGLLMMGTISQAESLAQEADASNMAFVEVVSHSHVSVVSELNDKCQFEFEAFNKRSNGKIARDYYVDITTLKVIQGNDSYGEAVCLFSKIIEN